MLGPCHGDLDLLFSKVGEIDQFQQKMDNQFDATTQVMEQMLGDHQLLSKQIEATGKRWRS